MSYSIDLEQAHLLCRTPEHAHAAIKLIEAHVWMRSHLKVSVAPSQLSAGAPPLQLLVDYFDGSNWSTELAAQVWLALVPHLADRSWMVIRTEQGERFRYRWEHGRVHHDEPVLTIWREYSLLGPFTRVEEPDVIPKSSAVGPRKKTGNRQAKNSPVRQRR